MDDATQKKEEKVVYPSPSLCFILHKQKILKTTPIPGNCPRHLSLFFLYRFDFAFSLLVYELLVQYHNFSRKIEAKKKKRGKQKLERILKGMSEGQTSRQQNLEVKSS